MSFNVKTKKLTNVTVVKGDGEMDFHNFRLLRDSVEAALAEGDRRIILDFSKLSYLDSSALGSLLYSQKRVLEGGGQMLVVASDPMMDILNLTHLDNHFKIVSSVTKGCNKFSPQSEAQ